MELEPLVILTCTTYLWVFKFGVRLPKDCHQLVSVSIHNPRCVHCVPPFTPTNLVDPYRTKSSLSVFHYLVTFEFLRVLALRSVFWDVKECSLEDDTEVSKGFSESLSHALLVETLHFKG
jgi:hypothetical protein